MKVFVGLTLSILVALMGITLAQTLRMSERLADMPTRLELARGLEQAQIDTVQDIDRLYDRIRECCRE